MFSLTDFLAAAKQRLSPKSSPTEDEQICLVNCPECGANSNFLLWKANGSGVCLRQVLPNQGGEYRRYSLWDLGSFLGIDVPDYMPYGRLTDTGPVTFRPELPPLVDSLRGLRIGSTAPEHVAVALLEDPFVLDRYIRAAESSGVVGEQELLKIQLLATVSRNADRFHINIRDESAAGKTEPTLFVLSTQPPGVVLDLGGGMSTKALAYAGDLRRRIVFLDEADILDEGALSLLRQATTRDKVTRLVTISDPAGGFRSVEHTTLTEGMVLIQAGTTPLLGEADETRFLSVSADASEAQTRRILNAKAERSAKPRPDTAFELSVWRQALGRIKPCEVLVPFAGALSDLFPDQKRARRDYARTLALIKASACLSQRQRSCYEDRGRLMVVAVLEDYRLVHELAAAFIAQGARGLTPAQQPVFDIVKVRSGEQSFDLNVATSWIGKASTTVRDHLKALEQRGLLISYATYGAATQWRVVADTPNGLALPSPEELLRLTRNLRNLATDGFMRPETLTDLEPVTPP